MTPADKQADTSRIRTSDAFSTWHNLSDHWLRSPGAEALETETSGRRPALARHARGPSRDLNRGSNPHVVLDAQPR